MSTSIENVLYHSYKQNLKEVQDKKKESQKVVKNFNFYLGFWKYCYQVLFEKKD